MICYNMSLLLLKSFPPDNIFIILLVGLAAIVLTFQFIRTGKLHKKASLTGETRQSSTSSRRVNPQLIDKLNEELEPYGFAYDPSNDIFFSRMYCWQRQYGYCRLYDEASAPLSMIIDCEPIYFQYDGKRWLIELWKGQYGLTTGGEIGIYYTDKNDLTIPGFFTGTFFESASDEDSLHMAFVLKKDGDFLFQREGRHWWLTGFVLGEFSDPSDLSMEIQISFKNKTMCEAFENGLIDAGYTDSEYAVLNNRIYILYDQPHSIQPFTRTKFTDYLSQKRNKDLCEVYQNATKNFDNIIDKLEFIRIRSPILYEKILTLGTPPTLYDDYDIIKNYMNQNDSDGSSQ